MALKSIKGVEIFAAGKWNGDEYTVGHLDEMVRAFSETGNTYRPAIKLGHDEKQKLVQSDGLPAAGWVERIYRKGEKLLADFSDIPDKIYTLIKNRAYRRVSSEIYWNATVNGKPYGRLVGAVALLGHDLPGVECLNDIFKMYDASMGDVHCYDLDLKRFTIEIDKSDLEKEGESKMTPEQIAKLNERLDALEKDNKKYVADLAKKEEEIADLKKFNTDAKAKLAEAEKTAEESRIESEVAVLVSDKSITPAMKPFVSAFLGAEKKEYSVHVFTKKDGKDKKSEEKFSKVGLLKEILKLHSAVAKRVNVNESSQNAEAEESEVEDREQELDAKIKKYAKDNDVSYKDAYKVVMAEHNASDPDDDEADVEDDEDVD